MSCEHGPAVKCPDCDVESLHGLKAHLAGVKERSTKTAVHRDQLLEENKALRLRLAGVERDRKGHMETVELQHRALQEQQEKWSKLHEKCASVEKRAAQMEAVVEMAKAWWKARRAIPDAQLSPDPDAEEKAHKLYDTVIQELQHALACLD